MRTQAADCVGRFLPATGSSTSLLLFIAVACGGAGLVALVVSRRRPAVLPVVALALLGLVGALAFAAEPAQAAADCGPTPTTVVAPTTAVIASEPTTATTASPNVASVAPTTTEGPTTTTDGPTTTVAPTTTTEPPPTTTTTTIETSNEA